MRFQELGLFVGEVVFRSASDVFEKLRPTIVVEIDLRVCECTGQSVYWRWHLGKAKHGGQRICREEKKEKHRLATEGIRAAGSLSASTIA